MQAVSEDPAIEVASVRWERVQLIVEARTSTSGPVDPASLRLVPDGGGEPMAPTRATLDGDRLTIRFNVLVGPGLQPLAPGRWTLDLPVAARIDAGRPRARPGVGTFAARARHGTGVHRGRYGRAPPDPRRRVRRDRPAHARGATAVVGQDPAAPLSAALVSVSRLVRRRGRHRVLFASR